MLFKTNINNTYYYLLTNVEDISYPIQKVFLIFSNNNKINY